MPFNHDSFGIFFCLMVIGESFPSKKISAYKMYSTLKLSLVLLVFPLICLSYNFSFSLCNKLFQH